MTASEPDADPEAEVAAALELLDNWDSEDSQAYQARLEAGLEPEPEADPDSQPEVQAAWQRHVGLYAEAGAALALGNEIGTPDGDKAYQLEHDAEVAYAEYTAAWLAAAYGPGAGSEDPELEADI